VRHYFTDHTSSTWPGSPPATGVKRAIKRILFRRYARVVGVSQYVADRLRDQGCPSELLATRYYFLNAVRFRPDPAVRAAVRREFDASEQFIIVVVAYLVAAKGVDVAIRALPRLPDPVRLWVVGGGPEAARLEDLCRELGVLERVRFFGHQPDVQRYLQAADCFVCPSRWGEAAGVVNLEAQASGLPTLGSRIGGIPELIQDGRTGFLFPLGDFEQLADKIRLLYDDPSLLHKMRYEARIRAVERFAAENRIEGFLDLYRVPR
jgi:glycosyltransferase involved in cell wall biosynthesis